MRRHLILLTAPLVVALAAGCDRPSGPLIRVVNADTVTLDRVMIEASGSEYALGRLLPGTSAQVRPVPAPDSAVGVRHGGRAFTATARFTGAAVVEIRLTADSIAEVRTAPR